MGAENQKRLFRLSGPVLSFCRWGTGSPYGSVTCLRWPSMEAATRNQIFWLTVRTLSFPRFITTIPCFIFSSSINSFWSRSFSLIEGEQQIPLDSHFLERSPKTSLKSEEIMLSVSIPHSTQGKAPWLTAHPEGAQLTLGDFWGCSEEEANSQRTIWFAFISGPHCDFCRCWPHRCLPTLWL